MDRQMDEQTDQQAKNDRAPNDKILTFLCKISIFKIHT